MDSGSLAYVYQLSARQYISSRVMSIDTYVFTNCHSEFMPDGRLEKVTSKELSTETKKLNDTRQVSVGLKTDTCPSSRFAAEKIIKNDYKMNTVKLRFVIL